TVDGLLYGVVVVDVLGAGDLDGDPRVLRLERSDDDFVELLQFAPGEEDPQTQGRRGMRGARIDRGRWGGVPAGRACARGQREGDQTYPETPHDVASLYSGVRDREKTRSWASARAVATAPWS